MPEPHSKHLCHPITLVKSTHTQTYTHTHLICFNLLVTMLDVRYTVMLMHILKLIRFKKISLIINLQNMLELLQRSLKDPTRQHTKHQRPAQLAEHCHGTLSLAHSESETLHAEFRARCGSRAESHLEGETFWKRRCC